MTISTERTVTMPEGLPIQEAVERCIAVYMDANAAWTAAVKEEMELEQARHLVKRVAVLELIGTDNPETNKPHSASSAEKAAETNDRYRHHLAQQTQAVVTKNTAFAAMKAAEFRVELALLVARHYAVDRIEGFTPGAK